MRDADAIIEGLCVAVDRMENLVIHDFRELDRAQTRSDLALHPDDMQHRTYMIASRAEILRRRAHEMEMLVIALKADALKYQLEAFQ